MRKQLSLATFIAIATFTVHAELIDGEAFTFLDAKFKETGPKVGEAAPDFALGRTVGGALKASTLWSKKPLMVTTGSYTCPQFREVTPARKALVEEFGDKVNFVVIYTLEAHPKGAPCPYFGREHITQENVDAGILLAQHADYASRLGIAKICRDKLGLISMVVVDKMDNAVWKAYGSSPNCAYLIDTNGKVVVQQGLFDAKAMKAQIEKLVAR